MPQPVFTLVELLVIAFVFNFFPKTMEFSHYNEYGVHGSQMAPLHIHQLFGWTW